MIPYNFLIYITRVRNTIVLVKISVRKRNVLLSTIRRPEENRETMKSRPDELVHEVRFRLDVVPVRITNFNVEPRQCIKHKSAGLAPARHTRVRPSG